MYKPNREPLDFPFEGMGPSSPNKKALLHSCCAPCSGEVIEAIVASGIDLD
ncbi:MAG: Epoxyqueuosine reductase QueH [Candidatus Midichloria mitochondrii]|uniref:Queuosine biosynthesis protein QueH n=1 Tax=Midichloria mitochondrii (strain IricVA) TaxID=696127 RepID=F7XVF4_MIDMI|nr:hypothetical protein midi_00343 [Candidatus Midichloria mitochondrii IricVA]